MSENITKLDVWDSLNVIGTHKLIGNVTIGKTRIKYLCSCSPSSEEGEAVNFGTQLTKLIGLLISSRATRSLAQKSKGDDRRGTTPRLTSGLYMFMCTCTHT